MTGLVSCPLISGNAPRLPGGRRQCHYHGPAPALPPCEARRGMVMGSADLGDKPYPCRLEDSQWRAASAAERVRMPAQGTTCHVHHGPFGKSWRTGGGWPLRSGGVPAPSSRQAAQGACRRFRSQCPRSTRRRRAGCRDPGRRVRRGPGAGCRRSARRRVSGAYWLRSSSAAASGTAGRARAPAPRLSGRIPGNRPSSRRPPGSLWPGTMMSGRARRGPPASR